MSAKKTLYKFIVESELNQVKGCAILVDCYLFCVVCNDPFTYLSYEQCVSSIFNGINQIKKYQLKKY